MIPTIKNPVFPLGLFEILAQARISYEPKDMRLHDLTPREMVEFTSAILAGFKPFSVRWTGGQFAIVFCERGQFWPKPVTIMRAYLRYLKTSKIYPSGKLK